MAGPSAANPANLIESTRMMKLIEDAEQDYDLVVIDAPPILIVPDAVPLVKQVSGVIVVARPGVTARDAARQLRAQLDRLDAPTLGLVVNAVEPWRERYGYAQAYESEPARAGAPS
jgi:Mrp family chromosome partitioning ATPase